MKGASFIMEQARKRINKNIIGYLALRGLVNLLRCGVVMLFIIMVALGGEGPLSLWQIALAFLADLGAMVSLGYVTWVLDEKTSPKFRRKIRKMIRQFETRFQTKY